MPKPSEKAKEWPAIADKTAWSSFEQPKAGPKGKIQGCIL